MSILDEMEHDLIEAEKDMGNQTIAWENNNYPCTPSGTERRVEISEDGNPLQVTATITVRNSQFPSSIPPASGDIIIYKSLSLKVSSAQDISCKLTRLVLIDPNT